MRSDGRCGRGRDYGTLCGIASTGTIGLDTNVVVRYLVGDDVEQTRRAAALIDDHQSESNPGFISTVVLAETLWVLERVYGLSHKRLAEVLESLLQADALVIEAEADAFSDAFIGALARRAGCSKTSTFDRRTARLPEFTLLAPDAERTSEAARLLGIEAVVRAAELALAAP
jgi:predicted nucleic-acid-binding protein